MSNEFAARFPKIVLFRLHGHFSQAYWLEERV